MEQFEVGFINDLKRLGLTRQDVYNKLEVTQPTLKSRLQKLDGLTYNKLKKNIEKVIQGIPRDKYENIFTPLKI